MCGTIVINFVTSPREPFSRQIEQKFSLTTIPKYLLSLSLMLISSAKQPQVFRFEGYVVPVKFQAHVTS